MRPSDPLSCYVIYDHPRDFPDAWVVRRQDATAEGVVPAPVAHTYPSLEKARASIPDGLFCVGRHPDDAPSIYEIWL